MMRSKRKRCENRAVAEPDLQALTLDVYDTKEGLWTPEHGAVELPEGEEVLTTSRDYRPRLEYVDGGGGRGGERPGGSDQTVAARGAGGAGCSSDDAPPVHRLR